MRLFTIILLIVLTCSIVQAKPNYAYTLDNTNSVTQKQQTYTNSNFKIGGGVAGGKGYVKLKYRNKQVVKLSTKKVNNNLLKLVSINL